MESEVLSVGFGVGYNWVGQVEWDRANLEKPKVLAPSERHGQVRVGVADVMLVCGMYRRRAGERRTPGWSAACRLQQRGEKRPSGEPPGRWGLASSDKLMRCSD